MRCSNQGVGLVAAAFGAGVLIGGILPCLVVKWLLGLTLIAVGVAVIWS